MSDVMPTEEASGGYNCGSQVSPNCMDLQIPWGEDWTFQMILGDVVDAAQLLIKFGVQYIEAGITDNLMKAINALRCAITNLGENSWNVIAAAFWTAVGFGQAETVAQYLDEGYQWICTCQEDANKLVRSWGAEDDGGRTDALLGSCTESGTDEKEKGKEAQKERVKARQ